MVLLRVPGSEFRVPGSEPKSAVHVLHVISSCFSLRYRLARSSPSCSAATVMFPPLASILRRMKFT